MSSVYQWHTSDGCIAGSSDACAACGARSAFSMCLRFVGPGSITESVVWGIGPGPAKPPLKGVPQR